MIVLILLSAGFEKLKLVLELEHSSGKSIGRGFLFVLYFIKGDAYMLLTVAGVGGISRH